MISHLFRSRTRIVITLMLALVGLIAAPMTSVAQTTFDCTYTVQSGDNLTLIARRYGIELIELQRANQDDYPVWSGVIRPGWVLAVPCNGSQPPAADPGSQPPVSDITARSNVNLNIRTGYSVAYQRLGVLPAGTTVPLEARSPNSSWVLINYNGLRGWIAGWLASFSADISTLPVSYEVIDATSPPPNAPQPPTNDPQPPAGPLTATPQVNMNVRAGSGTNYAIIGSASAGVPLRLEARNISGNWVLFNENGSRGWVAAWLTDINGNVNSLPVSDEIIGQPADNPANDPPPASNNGPVPYVGQYTNIGPNLRSIYNEGRQQGNNWRRFSKIGDSETDNPYFLNQFDSGNYYLGEYGYLSGVISTFSGSFSRDSYGANGGYVVDTLLNPFWAFGCPIDQNAVVCEYTRWKPAYALILIRTYPDPEYQATFEAQAREVIETSIDYGVIPVMSSIPHIPNPGGIEIGMNNTIRRLANEYQVPYWDLWATTEVYPQRGVDETAHLTIPPDGGAANFEESYLTQYGINRRNLESLEVLHALLQELVY